MSTDFTYGGKQIVSGGPLKPNGKDMPSDARTRVDCYADIATIPNPYVGLKITVKVDETNNNKMTDYIVKSLKANSIGVANSLIDEVVRYVDYLGANTSGSSGEGLTSTQKQQLQTAYNHSQSTHVTSDDLLNIDAVSLNGKKFSDPMTKVEYDAIANKDSNTIYLIDDDYSVIGVPNFTQADTGKYLAVNSDGTALNWNDSNFVTSEEMNTAIGNNIITKKTQSEYDSLSEDEKTGKIYLITDYQEPELSLTYSNNVLSLWKGSTLLSSVTINSSSIEEDTNTYGNIIVSKESTTITKGERDTFTVKLDSAPSSTQTVTLTSVSTEVSVSPETLSFTSDNYAHEQTVTISVLSSTSLTNASISLVSPNVSSKSIVITIENPVTDKTLTSISATYNQGENKIYPSTSLDSLKSNLVVTGTYDDNSTSTITGYSLSGTLTEGTSIITVTYNGKNTTFNVTVTPEPINSVEPIISGGTLVHSFNFSTPSDDGTYPDTVGSWNLSSERSATRNSNLSIERMASFSIVLNPITYSFTYSDTLFNLGPANGFNLIPTDAPTTNGRIALMRGNSYGNLNGDLTINYYPINGGTVVNGEALGVGIDNDVEASVIMVSDADTNTTKFYINNELVYTLNQSSNIDGFSIGGSTFKGKLDIYSGALKVGV